MGLDYMTYLGPYFECKVGDKKIDTDEVSQTLKESLVLPLNGCLDSLMKDRKVHVWLSNRRDRYSFDPTEQQQWQEVNYAFIDCEEEIFASVYAKECAILESFYGKDNVAIKFGMLNIIW